MAVLSTSVSARVQWLEAGRLARTAIGWALFAVGWLLAKTLRSLATAVAAALFAVGWVASALLWPALCWCGRAVMLGWSEGRKPIGGQRGPA